jgi:hypothetical protein
VITLCVRILGSVGALLTQGQGRQVTKLPKVSKNSKIAVQFRQLAGCDGVGSQSAHETNQKRSEPGMK